MEGRIALVQFRSTGDDRKDLRRMVGFVNRESGSADLIVFPELSIKRVFTSEEEKELLRGLQTLARNNMIDLVPGSFLIKSGGKTHNRSYYIDRTGEVLARYDKSNPWRSEKIEKGAWPEAFKTQFGRTVLIICWDLASPEISSRLAKLNLDLIICPSMWWKGEESGAGTDFTGEMIDALCLARCYESRAALAYVNAAGKVVVGGVGFESAGHSQAVAPFLNVISSKKGNAEGMIHFDFNQASLILAKGYLG